MTVRRTVPEGAVHHCYCVVYVTCNNLASKQGVVDGKAKKADERYQHNAGENKYSPFDVWAIHLHDGALQPFPGFLLQPSSY